MLASDKGSGSFLWLRLRCARVVVLAVLLMVALSACTPLVGHPPKRYSTSAPTRAPQDPESTGDLVDRAVSALQTPGAHQIVATEGELNGLLLEYLDDPRIESLTLWLLPNEVYARASLNLRGQHSLSARLAIGVRSGKPRVQLVSGTLDDHRLPAWVLLSTEAAINDALTDADLPFVTREVTIDEGIMSASITSR